MSGYHGLPIYRAVNAQSEVSVFTDGVVFRTAGGELRIDKHRLVGATNRSAKNASDLDIVVVVFRDADGDLAHMRWTLAERGKSRELSNAIYRIIDRGFLKCFTTFRYIMSHRIGGFPDS